MRHTEKNVAHLEKCATLKKMRHTWKNAPHLKNVAQLEICATLKKMRTIGKMRHT